MSLEGNIIDSVTDKCYQDYKKIFLIDNFQYSVKLTL